MGTGCTAPAGIDGNRVKLSTHLLTHACVELRFHILLPFKSWITIALLSPYQSTSQYCPFRPKTTFLFPYPFLSLHFTSFLVYSTFFHFPSISFNSIPLLSFPFLSFQYRFKILLWLFDCSTQKFTTRFVCLIAIFFFKSLSYDTLLSRHYYSRTNNCFNTSQIFLMRLQTQI